VPTQTRSLYAPKRPIDTAYTPLDRLEEANRHCIHSEEANRHSLIHSTRYTKRHDGGVQPRDSIHLKRPIDTPKNRHSCIHTLGRTSTKKPYISPTLPGILSKDTPMQKSPVHTQKSPIYAQKSPTYTQKSPTYTRKSPEYTLSPKYTQKSPTYTQKSPMYIQKSPIQKRASNTLERSREIGEIERKELQGGENS